VECGVSGIIIEVPASRHIIKYGYGWTLDRAVKASIEATPDFDTCKPILDIYPLKPL